MIATQNLEVGEVKSQNLTLDSVKTQDIELMLPDEVVILENNLLNTKYASGQINISASSSGTGGANNPIQSSTSTLVFTELAKKYSECTVEFEYSLNPNNYGAGSVIVAGQNIVPYPPASAGNNVVYTRNSAVTVPVNTIVSNVYAKSFSTDASYRTTMSLKYTKITLKRKA